MSGLAPPPLPLALFQKEVKQGDDGKCHPDHPEVVEIVSFLIFVEADIAHDSEIDEQDEGNEC